MSFTTDNGGFKFKCEDAKMSYNASTWSTRLSQLAKTKGRVSILTSELPDPVYVLEVLSKRPRDIYIVTHIKARAAAEHIKAALPEVRIALHHDLGAKALMVAPETVWIMSSDFGEKKHRIDSGVGFHSPEIYEQTVSELFERAWREALEIY
ncbi:hypothetical protein [Pseudomonas sp. GM30]|uniref:hypothetical protein n=1 Tax=Pseudomonas sp. GM30 TaxID=1144328 RepID=UPI0002700B91|nr:hypothetical protein [Pseudomonas sp. GM30]EUB86978.1 hypothetical protein PMI25_004472 [Pseudomonas sp. GM30]